LRTLRVKFLKVVAVFDDGAKVVSTPIGTLYCLRCRSSTCEHVARASRVLVAVVASTNSEQKARLAGYLEESEGGKR